MANADSEMYFLYVPPPMELVRTREAGMREIVVPPDDEVVRPAENNVIYRRKGEL